MLSQSGFLTSNSWLFFPIGVFVTLRVAVSIVMALNYFWNTHIKVRFMPREDMKSKYASWAVVTGCTSGIGEQFVHELASLGMNIVLISRSKEKLDKQSAQTEKDYGVKTKVIACNYLQRDAYKEAVKQTQSLDIGLLVNNVGLNTDTGSRRFDEMTTEDVRNMVVVNSGAATVMTREFLPTMIARGRGCVLNIGSTSGYLVLPYQALYCATKSYMRSWSRAMDNEMEGSGVTVRCSLPQFVKTGMCKGNNFIYNFPVWTCHPRVYAHNALLTLDTPDMTGWWMYDFVLWIVKGILVILKPDIETPLIYNIMSFILPYCSTVSE